MARWQKPRPLDWNGLPVSVSSFNIMPIRDTLFSLELMILLVYNHADRTRRKLFSDLVGSHPADDKVGKPAGFGMAGGGVNPEWLEKSHGAAVREGSNESGVKIIRAREIPIPGKKNKLLILDKRTERLIRVIYYEDGHQVSVELKPNERAILNPMHYFLAETDWANSGPREFLLRYRDELVTEGHTTLEEIASIGIGINSLTREELLDLGLDDEEVGKIDDPPEKCEIGGFALVPLSRLRSMLETKWFFLDPGEDPDEYYKNGKMGPTFYVYRSHVERILQGLEIMGITS